MKESYQREEYCSDPRKRSLRHFQPPKNLGGKLQGHARQHSLKLAEQTILRAEVQPALVVAEVIELRGDYHANAS